MLMSRLCLFMLALTASGIAASAETMKLDTITVELALPTGYCAFSRSNPKDELRYAQQDAAQNVNNLLVLLLAAPCFEVAVSRVELSLMHPAIKNSAVWLQTAKPINLRPGMTRSDALAQIAKLVPRMSELPDEVSAQMRKDGVSVKSMLRVIDQDGTGLYAAGLFNAGDATVQRTLAGVVAWTVLSNRVFTFNLYSDDNDKQSFDILLAAAKDVTRRSVAATEALPSTR
jgi:hypothetical protein